MTPITYTRGDATAPAAPGPRIIAHLCNDQGRWGAGFVLALSRRWPGPEAAYRAWHQEGAAADFRLGAVQWVEVEPSLWVANLLGQHGVRGDSTTPPIRYEAVAACLETLGRKAQELGASVHMPRIGCGLAGGEWGLIEPLIVQALCARDVAVTVYDL